MTPKETYAASATGIASLLELIGDPLTTPDGKAPHPDEWLPRAKTWHGERANWAGETAKQRDYILKLEAKLKEACGGSEPSAGQDWADEIIGLLNVARGQRDTWEKHYQETMAAALRRKDAPRSTLITCQDFLRSVLSVAARCGVETNWPAFTSRCEAVLKAANDALGYETHPAENTYELEENG